MSPPIELISFKGGVKKDKADIDKTSISEICLKTMDIEKLYVKLKENDIECFSKPKKFDFSKYGFGKSKVMYFRDFDGNIIEAIEEM